MPTSLKTNSKMMEHSGVANRGRGKYHTLYNYIAFYFVSITVIILSHPHMYSEKQSINPSVCLPVLPGYVL